MLGKDIIKIIEENGLENYEFCVASTMSGNIKTKVNTVISWPTCEQINRESYNTKNQGNAKIAILTEIVA